MIELRQAKGEDGLGGWTPGPEVGRPTMLTLPVSNISKLRQRRRRRAAGFDVVDELRPTDGSSRWCR